MTKPLKGKFKYKKKIKTTPHVAARILGRRGGNKLYAKYGSLYMKTLSHVAIEVKRRKAIDRLKDMAHHSQANKEYHENGTS